MGKILRANLTDFRATTEELPEFYLGLGGRGLTSAIIDHEVPPLCDALGLDNKLVFAPAVLAATAVSNNGRLTVGAKSPLTGSIKEANSGGSAAQKLARLGISAVVLEGRAAQLCIMRIHKTGVAILPSPTLAGLGTYDVVERLKEEYGRKVVIITIGPAGEMMLPASSIVITGPDFQIRIAIRGGLGAVMGSKNIKAIVIDDTDSDGVSAKDNGKMKHATKSTTKDLGEDSIVNKLHGLGFCLFDLGKTSSTPPLSPPPKAGPAGRSRFITQYIKRHHELSKAQGEFP